MGFANLPRTARPFPNWRRINTRDNGGDSSYHDLTFQFRGRAASSPPVRGHLQVGAFQHQHRGLAGCRDQRLHGRDQRPHHQPLRPRVHAGTHAIDPRPPRDRYGDLGASFPAWQRGTRRLDRLGHRELADGPAPHGLLHRATAARARTAGGREGRRGAGARSRTTAPGRPTSGSTRLPSPPRPSSTPRDDPSSPAGSATRRTAASTAPASSSWTWVSSRTSRSGAPRSCALQAQASNVTNHPNFGNPDTNLSSPTYGQIARLAPGTLGSRVIVLGARLTF